MTGLCFCSRKAPTPKPVRPRPVVRSALRDPDHRVQRIYKGNDQFTVIGSARPPLVVFCLSFGGGAAVLFYDPLIQTVKHSADGTHKQFVSYVASTQFLNVCRFSFWLLVIKRLSLSPTSLPLFLISDAVFIALPHKYTLK
jgi:hypothetical protein